MSKLMAKRANPIHHDDDLLLTLRDKVSRSDKKVTERGARNHLLGTQVKKHNPVDAMVNEASDGSDFLERDNEDFNKHLKSMAEQA